MRSVVRTVAVLPDVQLNSGRHRDWWRPFHTVMEETAAVIETQQQCPQVGVVTLVWATRWREGHKNEEGNAVREIIG